MGKKSAAFDDEGVIYEWGNEDFPCNEIEPYTY